MGLVAVAEAGWIAQRLGLQEQPGRFVRTTVRQNTLLLLLLFSHTEQSFNFSSL
jgi:hypothetical protein